MLNKPFFLLHHKSLDQLVPSFCPFDLKCLHITPQSPSCAPNCRETQMGQSTALCIMHPLVHTHSLKHALCHACMRQQNTHDTRTLTSQTLKKKKSLETTVQIVRTAGPKGATQHIWADDESRQTLIARGPQGAPPWVQAKLSYKNKPQNRR